MFARTQKKYETAYALPISFSLIIIIMPTIIILHFPPLPPPHPPPPPFFRPNKSHLTI